MAGWFKSAPNASALAGAFGAVNEVFDPAAARAAAELEAQHELTVSIPSPGEKALNSGEIEISVEDSK